MAEKIIYEHALSAIPFIAMKRYPFAALLDKTSPPEGLLLLVLAVLIGSSTGLAAVFFIQLIAIIQNQSY
ncbi:MAG: hypothetical protein KKA76_17520, partial [Proteobacteria bacterium]|nr:hypothetical protein [Pseudomonadota bacterium]